MSEIIKIKKFSYNNKAHKKELQRIRDVCADEWFTEGFGCKRISSEPQYEPDEGRPDFLYVATEKGHPIGFLETSYIRNQQNKIDGMWLRLLSARTGRHGIGTKLVERFISDAQKNRRSNIKFILVIWGSGSAVGFYLKKGFKQYGATEYAVYRINSVPDVNRIRYFDLPVSYENRLPFRKKQDNMKRWKQRYQSLSEAREVTELPDLQRSQVILANDEELNQIKLFPSWAYHYGRRHK